jgi:hypothetical protein
VSKTRHRSAKRSCVCSMRRASVLTRTKDGAWGTCCITRDGLGHRQAHRRSGSSASHCCPRRRSADRIQHRASHRRLPRTSTEPATTPNALVVTKIPIQFCTPTTAAKTCPASMTAARPTITHPIRVRVSISEAEPTTPFTWTQPATSSRHHQRTSRTSTRTAF